MLGDYICKKVCSLSSRNFRGGGGVTYRAKICINEGRKKFPRLFCTSFSMPAPSSAYTNLHFENFSTLMFLKDGTCLLSSVMLYIFYEISRPMSLKYTSNTDFSFDLKRNLNTISPKWKDILSKNWSSSSVLYLGGCHQRSLYPTLKHWHLPLSHPESISNHH